jgi:hypothetical protein
MAFFRATMDADIQERLTGSLGVAVILYTDYADFLDLHGKSLKKSV